MTEIPLTNSSLKAKVDDDLAPQVAAFGWQLGTHGYACHNGELLMHRFVYELRAKQSIDSFPGSVVVEHVDHDKLNNQNSNLRLTSQSVNNFRSKGVAHHIKRDNSKNEPYVYHTLRMTWRYKEITILNFKEELHARIAQPIVKTDILEFVTENPFADKDTVLNFIRSKREEWKNVIRP